MLTPEQAAQLQATATEILANHSLAQAIDALSADVYEMAMGLVEDRRDTFQRLMAPGGTDDDAAAVLMAVLCGWMLGHGAVTSSPPADRPAQIGRLLVIAATAAGWSAQNAAAVVKRTVM